MRVLFAVTHLGFLRNFESTLACLAERGHTVHVVTDRRPKADVNDATPIVERLTSRFPDVFTWETLPSAKRDPWFPVSTAIREGLNYWRYLTPAFANAPKLRERGRRQAPPPVVWLSDLPLLRSGAGIRALTGIFRYLERAIPVRAAVRELFDREPPDVLLVTPLLYFGSRQVDYVRAAGRRGIASVLGVGSWDHLTTKGMIHELPDRIVVWNERQRTEAAELHGARPAQVTVTGAQAYDHWFATTVSTDRATFCTRVGLPADRPYCSTCARRPSSRPSRWMWCAAGSPPSAAAARRCGPAAFSCGRIRKTRRNGPASTCRRLATCRSGRGPAPTRSPATRAASTTTRCTTPTRSSA